MSWLKQALALLDWEGGFEERKRGSAQRDECPTIDVCDRRGSMIDNLYRKRVSEKKNAVNCSKIVQILHAYNFRNL